MIFRKTIKSESEPIGSKSFPSGKIDYDIETFWFLYIIPIYQRKVIVKRTRYVYG